MFDINTDNGSVRKKPYRVPGADAPDPATQRTGGGKGLDSAKMIQLHHQLLDFRSKEIDRQHDNRIEQATDEDFYDNIQWREEDAAQLELRGQVPLVYNVIATTVDWVLGTEKRIRADYKVLPRRKEDSKPAERKSQLLKYLSDTNKTPFDVSRAFADSIKVGIGWVEDGYERGGDGEPIYSRYESWRNMLWDSTALDMDLQDGRYMFRSKWVDLDVLLAIFTKRRHILEQSVDDADALMANDAYGDEVMDQPEQELDRMGTSGITDDTFGYRRKRVRAIEGWIKVPTRVKRLKGGTFDRELFDEHSPAHREAVDTGASELTDTVVMKMFVAIFTPAGMLYFGPSPYRHNRFPFTPIWGKRRGRDGMPYGLVRNLKGIQEDVNKRASKALYILSSNKIIMDEDAIRDEDFDDFLEEVHRPDAVIRKKRGTTIDINAERELADAHLDLMSRGISMIQSASGVTDENLGRETNARSGIAIGKRQDQGALATALYFDNLWYARQTRGEKQLSLIEQFMEERKAFRITNMRGKPEYIEVNDGLPENDIIRSKADYVISEEDWRATLRQAQVDSLFDLVAKMPPEMAMVMMDLLVEMMDVPNREEIVKRIRQLTKQRDPDSEEPTEEEVAAAQEAQQMNELQVQTIVAQLRKLLAEAEKAEAQTDQIKAMTIGQRVSTQSSALGAAEQALGLPGIAHVADHILDGAGYEPANSSNEVPMGLPAPPAQPVPAAPAAF